MFRLRTLVAAATLTAGLVPGAAAEPAGGDHAHHRHEAGAESVSAAGHHGGRPRPDMHAPIGVMGDHTHHAGGWMLSYRWMRMNMEGNRVGDVPVPDAAVLQDWMVSPTAMTMDMNMFGVMYAPHDRVTLMAMFPFLVLSMDHVTRTGGRFDTSATGIGDIGAAVLFELLERKGHQLILNFGMTFPTGTIDQTGVTPMSSPQATLLPYPMQLGSGTWDLEPGLTYNGHTRLVSWGGQAIGTIRIGRNEQDYALGDGYMLTGWGAWKVWDWVSLSGRLQWRQWFNPRGRDTRLDMALINDVVPTADPRLRGGSRLDVGPGANFVVPGEAFGGLRFAIEALFPVYQDLDGPQLETDWTVIVGTQYAF